jgi:BirA family biotin operon repressor/biotin-[acetyl-CoA-carboxylase] ligase
LAGNLIEFVAETGSTSDDLAARLRGGELVSEGVWLVADRQISGRGRRGRTWLDGKGNFMGSTVIHCRFGDPDPATISLVAGLAVHAAISLMLADDAQLLLKWPNDVMIGQAKLAGILLERAGDSVVVGIGVNLVAAPSLADRASASLGEFGAAPHRDRFAADLARLFDSELERWRSFGLEPLVRRWLTAGHPVGTSLRTTDAGGMPLDGTFAGLTADGALQLRLPDGRTHIVNAGEVHFAGPDH